MLVTNFELYSREMGRRSQKNVSKKKDKWLSQFDKRTAKVLSGIPPPVDKKKTADAAPKKSKKPMKSNALMPYKADQSILVVGDGNFSWSSSLCKKLEKGDNITATSFDSSEAVKVLFRSLEIHNYRQSMKMHKITSIQSLKTAELFCLALTQLSLRFSRRSKLTT
jgi:hypothetical protein